MHSFLNEYLSFGFAAPSELLERTPRNAVKAEQFAAALIPTRIRRDVDRNRRVQDVVDKLGSGEALSGDFAELVRAAADDVKAEEQRQLTEYVLRRKLILNVMDLLIARVREVDETRHAFHLEETLHQFICPMRVRGDDPSRIEVSDHDLWVVDERLTFTKYFASDVPVSQLVADVTSTERPDVLVWDRLHGLGMDGDEPLEMRHADRVQEARPVDYDERYSPMNQVSRYLTQLVNGEVEGLTASGSAWRPTASSTATWSLISSATSTSIRRLGRRPLTAAAAGPNLAAVLWLDRDYRMGRLGEGCPRAECGIH